MYGGLVVIAAALAACSAGAQDTKCLFRAEVLVEGGGFDPLAAPGFADRFDLARLNADLQDLGGMFAGGRGLLNRDDVWERSIAPRSCFASLDVTVPDMRPAAEGVFAFAGYAENRASLVPLRFGTLDAPPTGDGSAGREWSVGGSVIAASLVVLGGVTACIRRIRGG